MLRAARARMAKLRAVTRTITPEIMRAALAEVRSEPPARRSLLSVLLDAIEVGYAKLELATLRRSTQ